MTQGLTSTSRLLRALGDETRLRILHLLEHEELTCGDLMEILNLGQSRVSSHLAHLKEVGLVNDRRAGRHVHYRLIAGSQVTVWQQVQRESQVAPELAADLEGLAALRERRVRETRAYFDRVAANFGEELLPGRTWEGLTRALLLLAPRARYADLGIGDGLLTMMLAEIAESVTAVDVSPAMLRQLEQRAQAAGLTNIATVEGEIEDLPLPDAAFEVVVLSQALHHAKLPERALREARRILVRGGRVLVIDLLAHGEEWVQGDLQHVHLGFTEQGLEKELAQAGFGTISVRRAARDPRPPHFMTLVATGLNP